MEKWKEIAGYEGLYEVSDMGRVRSLNYGRTGKAKVLTPGNAGKGYLFVNLYKDGIRRELLVHRLVAGAFIPNPNKLLTVNHRNENKLDNSAGNLEWMTSKDNTAYSQARQVQMLSKSAGELLATFPSVIEAERRTGIGRSSICACCRGRIKSAGGYVWKYLPGRGMIVL